MATKVALVNMKGGVGKSTITVNLAWYFAATLGWDKRVLVVDLDPQFNASQYLMGAIGYSNYLERGGVTTWDIFEQYTRAPGRGVRGGLEPNSAIYSVADWPDGSCVHLVPSTLELAYSLRNPSQKEYLLARFVSAVEDKYDLVLFDCPPTESLFTTAAYLASDYVLVPVKAEFLSSIGLPLLVRSLEEFSDQYGKPAPELAGVVFNATSGYVPEEAKSREDVIAVADKNGWYVFRNEVPFSRSFPRSAREGKPIFNTSHVRARPIRWFADFAEEFAERVAL